MAVVEVTDINAGRPSVVGGGSIFPFVQNFQLAARNEGLGTRITTLLSHREKDIQELLGVPDGFALAAMVMVGWPAKLVTKLKRNPVEDFTFIEKFGHPIEAPK
jgi:nitroreductase